MTDNLARSANSGRTAPATAARAKRKARGAWFVVTLFGLGSALAVLTAGSVAAGPVLAALADPDAGPTPAHLNSFAQAWIPKPTYTIPAPPASLPTLLPMVDTPEVSASVQLADAQPTSTPGALLAEIVVDTPTQEYVLAESEASVVYEDAPAPSYGGNQYILVDISEQHMYVYDSDALLYSFVASTGINNATATGQFSVLDKIPNAYGSTWDIWMPNWMGIYWAGGLENGIHALPILPNGVTLWSGFLGRPISYGCVVLGSYEAQMLYDWANVGTPVEIRW
jgi:lipoprotein-anchoring transpeptidase ErfK/SrfK